MANRKGFEDYILNIISELTNKSELNISLYKNMFKSMSDKELEEFVTRLEGNTNLRVIAPIDGSVKITESTCKRLYKKMGYSFMTSITENGRTTDVKHNLLRLPTRLVSQTVDVKSSVTGRIAINAQTGQLTAATKSAKLSKPEVEALISTGADDILKELFSYRASSSLSVPMTQALERDGKITMKQLDNAPSENITKEFVNTIFSSAMIKSNL